MKFITKGKNIYLRKVLLSDANLNYLRWLKDKDVNQFIETRHQKHTVNQIKKYILNCRSNNSIHMAICINKNNKHIGNIKIGPINLFHKTADISYFLGEKKEWGKGYATEAVKLAVKYSFKKLNLAKCSAGVYGQNLKSSKVLKKSGFKKEAILKSEVELNFKRDDRIIYAIINKNYKNY